MKIAITGANGFLGCYLIRECLKNNAEVVALIRTSANSSLVPSDKNLTIERIDYSNRLDDQFEVLKSKQGKFDFFIHNAGTTVSVKKVEYFDVNTDLTEKIVASLKRSKLLSPQGKFIYVSSFASQGPSDINKPVSHYGMSKKKAEEIIQKIGINYLIIRPTAIYGAGDSAFLPLFKSAAKGIYPLTRHTQKMSMIHASDLSRIIFEEMQKNVGIIHVDDGKTYSHHDFIQSLEIVTQKKMRIIPIPDQVSAPLLTLSDIWYKIINKKPKITREKLQEISKDWNLRENQNLIFSKIHSKVSLEAGFRDTFEFYKNNKML